MHTLHYRVKSPEHQLLRASLLCKRAWNSTKSLSESACRIQAQFMHEKCPGTGCTPRPLPPPTLLHLLPISQLQPSGVEHATLYRPWSFPGHESLQNVYAPTRRGYHMKHGVLATAAGEGRHRAGEEQVNAFSLMVCHRQSKQWNSFAILPGEELLRFS